MKTMYKRLRLKIRSCQVSRMKIISLTPSSSVWIRSGRAWLQRKWRTVPVSRTFRNKAVLSKNSCSCSLTVRLTSRWLWEPRAMVLMIQRSLPHHTLNLTQQMGTWYRRSIRKRWGWKSRHFGTALEICPYSPILAPNRSRLKLQWQRRLHKTSRSYSNRLIGRACSFRRAFAMRLRPASSCRNRGRPIWRLYGIYSQLITTCMRLRIAWTRRTIFDPNQIGKPTKTNQQK